MKSYDVPGCVLEFMRHRDLVDSDYSLYGAGRAGGWVKMSADAIDMLSNDDLKVAEYHCYAGVSAARTAIDALANWLNAQLALGQRGLTIDFKKSAFKDLIEEKAPSATEHVEQLASLATRIDESRQRAQHREGLALLWHEPGGWHLTQGLQAPRESDEHLASLLRRWADEIERAICGIVEGAARKLGHQYQGPKP